MTDLNCVSKSMLLSEAQRFAGYDNLTVQPILGYSLYPRMLKIRIHSFGAPVLHHGNPESTQEELHHER